MRIYRGEQNPEFLEQNATVLNETKRTFSYQFSKFCSVSWTLLLTNFGSSCWSTCSFIDLEQK